MPRNGIQYPQRDGAFRTAIARAPRLGPAPRERGGNTLLLNPHTHLPAARSARRVGVKRASDGEGRAASRDSAAMSREMRCLHEARDGSSPRLAARAARPPAPPRCGRGCSTLLVDPHPPASRARGAGRARATEPEMRSGVGIVPYNKGKTDPREWPFLGL